MSDEKNKRKLRSRDKADVPEKTRKVEPPWWVEFWNEFNAVENDDWNDGQETCGAKLYYYTSAKKRMLIVGATGEGAGHAEMHALDQFIKHVCGNDPKNLGAYQDRGLEIECTAKACCVRCSIILGALDFSAAPDTKTYKATKSMGKTAWNLVPNTRKFLRGAVSMTEDHINLIARLTTI